MTALLLLFLAACGRDPASNCPQHLVGTWEYRQAAGDSFDPEGERLELSCKDGALRGIYFGLEREGEHGLFYTLVETKDLGVSPAGELTFIVPERELYAERPRSLEALRQTPPASSGFTRDTLRYRGRVESQSLVLTCESRMETCPDKRLVFKRGPL